MYEAIYNPISFSTLCSALCMQSLMCLHMYKKYFLTLIVSKQAARYKTVHKIVTTWLHMYMYMSEPTTPVLKAEHPSVLSIIHLVLWVYTFLFSGPSALWTLHTSKPHVCYLCSAFESHYMLCTCTCTLYMCFMTVISIQRRQLAMPCWANQSMIWSMCVMWRRTDWECHKHTDLKTSGVLQFSHLFHDDPLHHIYHQTHTVPSDQ